MSLPKDKFIIPALICLIIGAGLVFKWLYLLRSSPLGLSDLYFYQGIAQAFLARDWTHFWHFHFYPGYPVLMAIFHQLTHLDFISCARWLNFIFDALSTFPIYLIGKNLYGKRVGIFSALFWCLSWPKVRAYGDPEPVYAFFIFSGLALLFRGKAWSRSYLLALSLASLAGLVKSESLLFVFFFTMMYLIQGREGFGKKILTLIFGILLYLVLTFPLWFNYYQATGQFNPNPKSRTLFFIYNYQGSYQENLYGLKEDGYGRYSKAQRIYIEGDRLPIRESLFSYFWKNRKTFAYGYLDKLNFALKKDLKFLLMRIFPPAVFLALLYWIRPKRTFDLEQEAWLWFWALAVLFSVSIFDVWERFFYPMFPVLVIVCAKGLEQLIIFSKILAEKFFPRLKLALITEWLGVLFFILWFLSYNLGGLAKTYGNAELAKRFETKTKLARELKLKIDLKAKILCRGFGEPITYFLGLPYWQMVVLPYARETELMDYAREAGARYIFIEGDDIKRNPYAEKWLFGKIEEKGVKPLRVVPPELKDDFYPHAFYELELN